LGAPIPVPADLTKEAQVILKDPGIQRAWGLEQTQAFEAWRLSLGSRRVRVAVIDTGIDTDHPDLRANLWFNPGEMGTDTSGRNKSTNGIDDDGNGYADDLHGWNFFANSPNVSDRHGHGSHIAGIIGAVGGNGIGISGVAPKVSLMALKYYDSDGSGVDSMKTVVNSIRYAIKMKAHVINFSGGGLTPNPEEKAAIKEALAAGIIFVAAAGNEASNSDQKPYYPADYGLRNIVSVTALDSTMRILPSSNFGSQSVHLAAPGKGILSTLPGGKYGFMTGTSQATAFVSGVAALLIAHRPGLSDPEQLAKYLMLTGDWQPDLKSKTRFQTRLNSFRALAIRGSDSIAQGLEYRHIANDFENQINDDGDVHDKDETKYRVRTFPGLKGAQ